MPSAALPRILLIMDDDVDRGHAMHIFSKYHFSNAIVRLRLPREVPEYLSEAKAAPGGTQEGLPELVIYSPSVSTAAQSGAAIESLKREIGDIPLVFVGANREDEEGVRAMKFPNTYCMGKPLGFFKLLEAMQKLGMYWIVMRANP